MTKTKWYRKPVHLMVAVALVLSLGVLLVPTVSADPGELHVGPGQTYTKIQDALDAANPWDEIIVHPATYSAATNGESFPLVVKDDNLVIRSTAGAASTIIDAGNAQTNILEIQYHHNVDVDGFTLRNARANWWSSTGNGIYMNDADDCDISNLKIYDLTEGTSNTREPAGIFMENGSDGNTFSSIEIFNIDSDYQPRGIWCHYCSGNQFTDIYIHGIDNTDNSGGTCAYGIHLSHSSGNMFDEIMIDTITGGEWAEGIEFSYSDNLVVGDLSISNIIGDKYVYGILLLDSSYNTFASNSEIWDIIAAAFNCSIGIGMEKDIDGSNNNTFVSFDIHDTCYGFYIDKSSDNFITKSNIHDNIEGVHLCSEVNQCTGNRLECNNIFNNRDYGVYKQNIPDVDARDNWWGAMDGPSHSPGSGDKVSANVLYDPWLLQEFQYCKDCGYTPQPPVGGEAYPVSRLAILAPWIALIAAIITGATIIWRRRRAQG